MNSIPTIGTAVVNSTYWVSRLIMSVDYPVDNFVIINNNGTGELDNDLDNLKTLNKKFIKKITVTHLPANIGCAGAWNLIRSAWVSLVYACGRSEDLDFFFPGKAMRLMAADVTAGFELIW